MKLEVGMIARTNCGLIAKVQSINDYNIAIKNTCCNRLKEKYFTFPNEDKIYEITKASFNIIDLIKVGDIVNGYEIIANKDEYEIGYFHQNGNFYTLLGTEIKSILTHELYEANCYKVVE